MGKKKKKKQPKSSTKRKRTKKYAGPKESLAEAESTEASGGAMSSMVGGFRRAVGVEDKKKKGWADHIWTILLLLAVASILFWKFGRG